MGRELYRDLILFDKIKVCEVPTLVYYLGELLGNPSKEGRGIFKMEVVGLGRDVLCNLN